MAQAVVSFVLERIGDLLIEEAKFLHGVEHPVVALQTELNRMKCFLEDADAIRDKNKRVHNWITEVRDLAYRSENIVENFIVEIASRRGNGGIYDFIRRSAGFLNEGVTLHKLGSEMETIKVEISSLASSLQSYGIKDMSPRAEGGSSSAQEKRLLLRRTYSHVVEEDFVGFQEDIAALVAALVDEDKQYRAISICGMGGSGKTTLATKVYHHPTVRRRFDAFAWACISQEWKKEDVLQRILINLMPEKREVILTMRDEELVKQLFEIQGSKNCLVVLDDIWSTDVWNIIRSAFPNRKMGSKILLTSRYEVVAEHVDPSGFLHKTRLLDDEESWELFRKKAFLGGDDTDSTINQKMELGRETVKHCRGLPLAIVVLGGLLVRKHQLNEWQTVHRNIGSYLMGDKIHGEQGMGVSEILALSFHDLPYWLKPCFLFLANYPEDKEIETEKLYQLWMAEGFISVEEEGGEEETMMEVAERYLGELAQRCMVQVQIEDDDTFYSTTSGYRRYKSCRLHDLMREMCLSMVKEENFLKIVDFRHRNEQQHYSSSSSSSPFLATSSTHSNKIHRLAMYLDGVLDEDTNRDLCFDQGKSIRSVLLFCREKFIFVSGEQVVSHLFKNFKLARVLDLQGLVFSSDRERPLPKTIGNLIHLRYLSLRKAGFHELPSSVGNLKYLETLDLRVIYPLTVPNVLWKLERLRHLYFHGGDGFLVTNGKLQLDGLNNLETLKNFHVECCNVKDLHKLTNLQKLTVPSAGQELTEITSYLMSVTQKRRRLRYSSVCIDDLNFYSEAKELTLLRQLLLECHHLNVHKLRIDGLIRGLPEFQQCYHSSSSLTHLILCDSELTEDPLAILEKLPNLIDLSLASYSFVGTNIVCTPHGFPRLKYLNFLALPNLEEWKVDEGAMANLSTLKIMSCPKLNMVPEGLRFVIGLQKLEVDQMPLEFINRLRVLDGKEGDDLDKVRHVPSINLGEPGVLECFSSNRREGSSEEEEE